MVDQGIEDSARAQGWLGEAVPVLFLVASVLLGLAIAASIASCWMGASDLLSFGLSVGVFAATAGAAAWASKHQKPFVSDILLALASLSFAAMLGHMSQAFDVAEDRSGFFLALATGVFLIAVSGSSIITTISWLIIFIISIFSLKNDNLWLNKFTYMLPLLIFYMINIFNKIKNNLKFNYLDIKIDMKKTILITCDNFLCFYIIFFVSVNLGVIGTDGVNPPDDFVSYICSLIFMSITLYVGLARFSERDSNEHQLSAAIVFGWLGSLSLACLLLISIQPLDLVGTLTLGGVWIAEASILFYIAFKTRHTIGLCIAIAAFVSVFCAGLVGLGLAWSGVVAGLLIACLLLLGVGLVILRRNKIMSVPL